MVWTQRNNAYFFDAGVMETGVQGVQVHTHFLAPPISKDQGLSLILWLA